MRIVAGRWRGRRLPVVAGAGLRPTPDRVRETLFNWLQPILPGARCLDLFAGSGALGLEAASRGAARVVLVEQDFRAATAIRESIETLGAERVQLVELDALKYLSGTAVPWDVVFLDPPFGSSLLEQCVRLLAERAWLEPEARVYLETSARGPSLALPPNWGVERESRAGEVAFCLLRAGFGQGSGTCPPGRRWP